MRTAAHDVQFTGETVKTHVKCLKEVCAMFCKPFRESAPNNVVLNTGFKSEVIVWLEKQMKADFIL
jgi:hypothetical protein